MVENVDEKIGAMSEKIQHISINKMPSKNLRVHEMPTGPPKSGQLPPALPLPPQANTLAAPLENRNINSWDQQTILL